MTDHVCTITEMLDTTMCAVCGNKFTATRVHYLVEHRDAWTFRHYLVVCSKCEENKPHDYFRVANIA